MHAPNPNKPQEQSSRGGWQKQLAEMAADQPAEYFVIVCCYVLIIHKWAPIKMVKRRLTAHEQH